MFSVSDIRIGYGARTLAEGISFRLSAGECVLLAGANGSGKTTLLRTLAGLSEDIAMVPARVPKVAGFTLREFIHTGCWRESDHRGRLRDEAAVDAAMDRLGIRALEDRDIATLSDGEFQKGCIATALARKAPVVLLDEPTAWLDVDNRAAVLQALREVSEDRAVLFSSHDLHDSLAVATRVMGLAGGRLLDTAAGTDREEVLRQCFATYGR